MENNNNSKYGTLSIRLYQEGDEAKIIPVFNEIFNTSRTKQHWQWKFKENPFGGPIISLAWDKNQLASQFAGYPIELDINDGKSEVIVHMGDIFTVQKYRNVGLGRNNLLAKTFWLLEEHCLKNNVFVVIGFNTGQARKLCRRFLEATIDLPIFEWHLSNKIENDNIVKKMLFRFYNYTVSKENIVGDWADCVYNNARKDYIWLVKRTKKYLIWRYEKNPDFDYIFYVIKKRGKPVGWLLIKHIDNKIYLVDALFISEYAKFSANIALKQIVNDYPDVDSIFGWFPDKPKWWINILESEGFEKKRQFQNLFFGIKSYNKGVDFHKFIENFYFTMGDSDLF